MNPKADIAVAIGLLVIASFGGACGSNADGPTYFSDSFSPTTGVDASGAATPELWWRSRTNGGAPIVQADGSLSKFGDQEKRISAGGTRETISSSLTSTPGTSAGTTTQEIRSTSVTHLVVGPPATTTDSTMESTQDISSPTGTTHVDRTLDTVESPLQSNFADRTDLDQLPVGYAEETSFTTTWTESTTSGGSTTTTTWSAMYHYRRTIVDQLPTMTVLGTTYRRVVKVESAFDVTDAAGQRTVPPSDSWYAGGIGLIRSASFFPTEPTLVISELVDSNLRQR